MKKLGADSPTMAPAVIQPRTPGGLRRTPSSPSVSPSSTLNTSAMVSSPRLATAASASTVKKSPRPVTASAGLRLHRS